MSFQEYVKSYPNFHQHPINKAIHLICIPLIIISMILMGTRYWRWGIAGFILGWTAQIVGHRIEGNKPALTGNPIYILAAPVWYFHLIKGYFSQRKGKQ